MNLSPKKFYNLTYRQFANMLNGYNKQKDTESQERLIVMRNIMWSAMMSTQKKGFKPTDIITFDFEKPTLKKMSALEYAEFENEIEKVKAFYAQQEKGKFKN